MTCNLCLMSSCSGVEYVIVVTGLRKPYQMLCPGNQVITAYYTFSVNINVIRSKLFDKTKENC